MEDGGNWFLYVAMVVIAFVSWVFNKIQEATAARRRDQEIEQYQQDLEEHRSYYEDEEAKAEAWENQDAYQEPEPRPQPAASNAEDAMQQLMEALGGPVTKPPPPPPKVRTQAVRQQSQEPKKQQLSAEEKAALERIRQRREAARARKAERSGSLAEWNVADLVRDPDGIRKAVILREILDRPRAERSWGWE